MQGHQQQGDAGGHLYEAQFRPALAGPDARPAAQVQHEERQRQQQAEQAALEDPLDVVVVGVGDEQRHVGRLEAAEHVLVGAEAGAERKELAGAGQRAGEDRPAGVGQRIEFGEARQHRRQPHLDGQPQADEGQHGDDADAALDAGAARQHAGAEQDADQGQRHAGARAGEHQPEQDGHPCRGVQRGGVERHRAAEPLRDPPAQARSVVAPRPAGRPPLQVRHQQGECHRQRHFEQAGQVVVVDIGAERAAGGGARHRHEHQRRAGAELRQAQQRLRHRHRHEQQHQPAQHRLGTGDRGEEDGDRHQQEQPRRLGGRRQQRPSAARRLDADGGQRLGVEAAARQHVPGGLGQRHELHQRRGGQHAQRDEERQVEVAAQLAGGERGRQQRHRRQLQDQQRQRPVAAIEQRREDQHRGEEGACQKKTPCFGRSRADGCGHENCAVA